MRVWGLILQSSERTEWIAPCKNTKSHDANGPDVHSIRVGHFLTPCVGVVLDGALHLRSHVQRSASSGVCDCVIVDSSFAETKVCEFYPPPRAGVDYQNILCESALGDKKLVAWVKMHVRQVSDLDA